MDTAKGTSFPKVKKGAEGRIGKGRFNATFEAEKSKLTGTEDKTVKRTGGNFKKDGARGGG